MFSTQNRKSTGSVFMQNSSLHEHASCSLANGFLQPPHNGIWSCVNEKVPSAELNAKHVISTARGPSVKTMKTKAVV